MHDIHKIYSNEIGISFFWKQDISHRSPRVQLVFRDMGFLLTIPELKEFLVHCETTHQSQCCTSCENKNCRSLLLKTPSTRIDLAVSQQELEYIQQLIQQTILKAELRELIRNVSKN